MNLRFLETFVWAARLGSLSRTAERLHTTLAAASARIQTLERDLGVALFEREGRNLRLSAKGREALPLAERLVQAAAEFELSIRNPESLSGRIRLGVIDVAGVLLPSLLKTVRKRFPQVEIELHADTTQRIIERMQAGDLDIGITLVSPPVPGARAMRLFTLACHWMASPELIPEEREMGVDELADFPVVTFASGSIPHANVVALFQPHGGPRQLYCGSSLATMLQLIKDGFGVSAFPAALAQDELRAGRLRLLNLRVPFPPLDVQVGYMDGPEQTLMAAFSNTIVEMARDYCVRSPAEHAWMPAAAIETPHSKKV